MTGTLYVCVSASVRVFVCVFVSTHVCISGKGTPRLGVEVVLPHGESFPLVHYKLYTVGVGVVSRNTGHSRIGSGRVSGSRDRSAPTCSSVRDFK